MKKKSLLIFLPLLFWSLPLLAAQEFTSTLKDQQTVAVTIYNRDLALIKDQRLISLPAGQNVLAFRGVSAKIQPETALITGRRLQVLEQNFEFDLLTPQSLLQKYVGKKVQVIKKHPTTGAESTHQATLLATNNGVVLQMKDHIEMGVPGRLIFPDVPDDLRDKPTLTMLVDNSDSKPQSVELSYLSSGLGWQADYVAELNKDDNGFDIKGWVTLTNHCGATFPNARLQLVAGDVQQVEKKLRGPARRYKADMMAEAGAPMAEEQMFEYHLYTLDRPTTIKDNQTKQVALLAADGVGCKKEFLLTGSSYYYTSHRGEIGQKIKVGVYLEAKNSTDNRLGMPLPKGIVRVYKKDSHGNQQFVGEDRIDHTPENETIRLKLGDAFDVTATKKQTDFKTHSKFSRYNSVYEAAFAITLNNGKKEPVTVQVVEPIPGDWEILDESLRHRKKASNTAAWSVPIPPKGTRTLTYRVMVKY